VRANIDGRSERCNKHDHRDDLSLSVFAIEELVGNTEDEDYSYRVRETTDLTDWSFKWGVKYAKVAWWAGKTIESCWVDEDMDKSWNSFYNHLGEDLFADYNNWKWGDKELRKPYTRDWTFEEARDYFNGVDWATLGIQVDKWIAFYNWIDSHEDYNHDWNFYVDADWEEYLNWMLLLDADDFEYNPTDFVNRDKWIFIIRWLYNEKWTEVYENFYNEEDFNKDWDFGITVDWEEFTTWARTLNDD
jgi:hypothetical protein